MTSSRAGYRQRSDSVPSITSRDQTIYSVQHTTLSDTNFVSRPSRKTEQADARFYTASLIRIGNLRARFPVAANTAFATAGATGGTGGSPTPIGCSVLGTM